MTSNPLFISVAESMVMRWPIFHVGWFSACSTVMAANSDWACSGTGRRRPSARCARPPPSGRRAGTGARRCARCRWAAAACPGGGLRGDQFARGHQAFLVGQADRLSALHGFVGRFQAGDAHDGADHEIRFGMRGDAHRAARPMHHLEFHSPRSAARRRISCIDRGRHGNESGFHRSACSNAESTLLPAARATTWKSVGIGFDHA